MPNPIEIARNMVGTREGQAALNDYLKTGGQNIDPVTRAWCADFVNATLAQSGMKGTGSGMARSFLNYGQATNTPKVGDIAVFTRGDPNGPQGHVGFYQGTDAQGNIQVLGGNQGNAVSVASYAPDKLLGYRTHGTPQGGQAPTQVAQAPAPTSKIPEGVMGLLKGKQTTDDNGKTSTGGGILNALSSLGDTTMEAPELAPMQSAAQGPQLAEYINTFQQGRQKQPNPFSFNI